MLESTSAPDRLARLQRRRLLDHHGRLMRPRPSAELDSVPADEYDTAVARERQLTLLLTSVAAVPVAAVALWSLAHNARELSDPCAIWGVRSGQSIKIGAHDPCRARTGHSESKAGAAFRTAVVSGGLLFSSVLAVLGAAFARRRAMMVAGIVALAEAVVVFSLAPLVFMVGVAFLLIAKRLPAMP